MQAESSVRIQDNGAEIQIAFPVSSYLTCTVESLTRSYRILAKIFTNCNAI